ncbi:hypothetical protein [Paraburkholderia kururiensis]|uniref:hypothetical protein n=1 Tax=Paraburkholderia kururiensis TaxID=984307 RepID=UPI000F87BC42|nr:hypothetical protein [Paraburkholderia kururiensis]
MASEDAAVVAGLEMLGKIAPTPRSRFDDICRAGAAILILAVGGSCLAWGQTAASDAPIAQAPSYRIGDRWIVMYGKTAVASVVTSVTDTRTTFSETKNGGVPFEMLFYAQGNVVRSGDTSYDPCLCSLSFPMNVGKNWDSKWTVRNPSGSHESEAHVSVEAFEQVSVRAGAFDAFKIVMHGISTYAGNGRFVVPWDATFWYAPEVKRVVKSEAVFYVRYQGSHKEGFELSEFSLAR